VITKQTDQIQRREGMSTSKNVAIAVLSMSLIGSSMVANEFYNKNNLVDNKLHSQESKNHQLLDEQTKLNLLVKKQNATTVKLQKTIKVKNEGIHRLQKQLEKAKKRNESPPRRKVKKLVKKVSKVNHPHRKLNMTVTSYTAFCSEGCTGKTRSGYNVSSTIYYQGMHIVAADTSVLPMHSIIDIHTKQKTIRAIVLDTGGSINSYKLDLLSSSNQDAVNFGKQNATIEIIREGKG
jgi:3D (Asp-Asp-Asp) domain-containing protein